MSKDHLGNTRLVTDASMNVVARHDYLPFGSEIPAGYAGRDSRWGVSDAVSQKFTGKERDLETGLDFFLARYFSAAQGRFNSVDPANAGADPLNPQSWNGYSYVANNPMNATDPTGMYIGMDVAEGFGGGFGSWGDGWGSYYVDGAPVTASAFGHFMDMGVAVQCPDNICEKWGKDSSNQFGHLEFTSTLGAQGYLTIAEQSQSYDWNGNFLTEQQFRHQVVVPIFNQQLTNATNQLARYLGVDAATARTYISTDNAYLHGGNWNFALTPNAISQFPILNPPANGATRLPGSNILEYSTGAFHVDTMNPSPLWRGGVLPHFFMDVFLGNTLYASSGIPR